MHIRSMVAFLAGGLLLSPLTTHAASPPVKPPGEYIDDLKDYAVAPLHWDAQQWQWAAVAGAAVATTYAFDSRIRTHFADPQATPHGDPHGIRDAAPTVALTLGTLAFGALRHDDAATRTGFDMIEAVGISSLSSLVLKHAIGRTRPDQTSDRAQWFSGGDSFPSGHVSAAFAAAEVFAESRAEDEWGWRVLAYTLASATAYARVDGNMHWASDTVAGAALGIATGRFVSARGSDSQHSRVTAWVSPLQGGAMISFSVDPRL